MFRVKVDNYHAQIKRTDPPNVFCCREDAVDYITNAFFNAIDDDCVTKASKLYDYDAQQDKWEKEYSRLWKEYTNTISSLGYEDGDGRYWFVAEEE